MGQFNLIPHRIYPIHWVIEFSLLINYFQFPHHFRVHDYDDDDDGDDDDYGHVDDEAKLFLYFNFNLNQINHLMVKKIFFKIIEGSFLSKYLKGIILCIKK